MLTERINDDDDDDTVRNSRGALAGLYRLRKIWLETRLLLCIYLHTRVNASIEIH